ncbi:hypothetical protein S245_043299, partial [Arachis hypogaea]
NCIGAIDRTHIRIKIKKKKDVSKYRGRKSYSPINVLTTCIFDLKFSYVMPRWKRSASDSRILDNALNREDNLIAPQKYLQHSLKNSKKLFNLRYLSLRN